MRTLKILDIGDMQNGFTREDGRLYISGAREIIPLVNSFLRRTRNGFFDYTFIVLDTHFAEEYPGSEESRQFPIHCEYGTEDWNVSVDVSGLPGIRYLMKNQFTMWGGRSAAPVTFPDIKRKTAYDNLFHFLDDLHEPAENIPRDDFIRAISPGHDPANIDVTLLGVASDYCIRYALDGWLERGARVTIIEDLTKGIAKETPRVLCEEKYLHYGSGRVRSVTSAAYLQEYAGT